MPGHVSIKPLEWESAFFGVKTARLEPQNNVLPGREELDEWPLLQAKVMADQMDKLDRLNQLGFQLVEGEADLSLNIRRTARQTGIRIAREAQIPALREAALSLFQHSRFRSPWFPSGASGRLYAQWIENAVYGTYDHQCLLASSTAGELLGFVSLREAEGDARIGLLGVLPQARGDGLGQRLMAAAADWGRARQLARLRVGTQLSNLTAMRLYLRSGARLESTAYWLYRKGNDPI